MTDIVERLKPEIPSGIYWCETNGAFYRNDGELQNGRNFMGQDFIRAWFARRSEFPPSPWPQDGFINDYD